jgi:hypothetical protein
MGLPPALFAPGSLPAGELRAGRARDQPPGIRRSDGAHRHARRGAGFHSANTLAVSWLAVRLALRV